MQPSDAVMTGRAIIGIHYPTRNMKKAPAANTTMIKGDGFAWHAAFISKAAQAIFRHYYYYIGDMKRHSTAVISRWRCRKVGCALLKL